MDETKATARADAVREKMQAVMQEVYGDITPDEIGEDGDGDLWFVGGIHSPDMPGAGVALLSTMGFAESAGASMAMYEAFREAHEDLTPTFEALGFSRLDANRLRQVEVYRRHYRPETEPAITLALLDQLPHLEEDDAAYVRDSIHSLLEKMQAEGDDMVAANALGMAAYEGKL